MFNSIYHRKCKENGLFGIIVDYHRELLESGALAIDRRGFSQQLTIQPVYSIDNNFWALWNDSAMELDVPTRLRFFHHLKLHIERKAEDEYQTFGAFEKLRYETKGNPELKAAVQTAVIMYCLHFGFVIICARRLNLIQTGS